METFDKNNVPEKLVYTQTWEDVKYIIIILAIVIGIFIVTSKSVSDMITFIFVFLFISSLVLINFALFAIRRFELQPDKIIVELPSKKVKVILKSDIKNIIVSYQPEIFLVKRYRPDKMVFTFEFYKDMNILFWRRKLVVNNFIFGDVAKGEETSKVINYLKKYYADVLTVKI